MITNKSSFGYKLADTAVKKAEIEGLFNAKDFLWNEIKHLSTWEQLAIVQTFKTLCKGKNIRPITNTDSLGRIPIWSK